mgnify:CR=1 FL=1|jgi:Transcriptional regulator containing an amidase domain and an AraC-type DNA-binding HTH domain
MRSPRSLRASASLVVRASGARSAASSVTSAAVLRTKPNRHEPDAGPTPADADDPIWQGKLERFKYSDFSSGLPFSVVRCLPQRPREAHTHEFHEIVIVTHGSGRHVSRTESWPIQAGDVFVIGGPQAHYYDDVCDLRLVNILFQRRDLRLDTHDIGTLTGFQAMFGMHRLRTRHEFRSRFRLKPKDLAIVLAHVDGLEHELASQQAGRAYFSHAYFMLIVGYLSRLYSQQESFDSHAVLRLAKVISHMEENYAESQSMSALAKLAGMTERSFLRAFHLATGTSPHNHLLHLRINRAAAELRNPDRQITEVAFEVGFNDSNYFTRQFKKRMGLTPLEYRKRTMPPA